MEHTAADGKVYRTQFYNLDAIISIGYRVNSKRATQFRIWATHILKDHIVRGYTLNQKRISELKTINLRIAENKASLNELKEWVGTVRAKFAQTPSIWPVNGKIVSGYGFRIHPWRGLHLGIDIDVDRGTPV